MTITFKYKTVQRPDGTKVKTPSIPITMNCSQKFETLALLDSGADISAISLSMAEIIGLDLNAEKTPAFGIGGKVESIETTMSIVVEKDHEKYVLRVPVKIILGNFDFPVLLGRLGFFDEFVISFDQKNERVSLKKNAGR